MTGAGEDGIEVSVAASGWAEAIRDVEALARRSAGAALAAALDADAAPGALALCVLLTDDADIRRLNSDFRGRDAATNVLSWPSRALDSPASAETVRAWAVSDSEAERFLGDVALALETTHREAIDLGKPLEDHVAHLIVHGVLHLLGYDHEDDEDAASMATREVAALGRLGVGDPYGDPGAERPPDAPG